MAVTIDLLEAGQLAIGSLYETDARRHALIDAAPPPPYSPQGLLDRLAGLGIAATTHHHEAVFTVEESQGVTALLPGAHSKNLFLKDKKGRFFLVSACKEARIDLKRLHEAVGASGRLSFGTEEQLWRHLGVRPGSVSAFAVANDGAGAVTMVLDRALLADGLVNFHPLVNTMTTSVTCEGLMQFLRASGHEPMIVTLPVPVDAEVQGG
jgi:Ala-tRNA(Pro) deacylase